MCPIKQILTRTKAFCRRNQLKAIFTCMHGQIEFMNIFFFLTFQSDFVNSYANKKNKCFFFSVFFIFDMTRIPQNLRERAIGILVLNAGMTMNAVDMDDGCSTRAI